MKGLELMSKECHPLKVKEFSTALRAAADIVDSVLVAVAGNLVSI